MQGESSEEDKSTRGKPKKEKKAAEKHACFGTNASGADCAISATEVFCAHHFCHRHIADAQKFIDAKAKGTTIAEPVKPKTKATKTPETEPVSAKQAKPTKKKVVAPPPPPPPESEPEEEELEEEDYEDQQETDTEQ